MQEKEFEEINLDFRLIFKIIFILLMIFYTIYHIYNGNYGFKSYITKQDRLNQKNIELLKAQQEISNMEHRIKNLQSNNLDSDLLDEEIRKNTGYAKKNEIIIYSNSLK